ncbi:RNase adapter RapZ [Deinococcus sonorensis]|uniref:RNase adapter RapZ n=2 Tax=Deinococcus sonorensis TaxID=309891 RepID=A0AAU7UB10_9DEIO
MSFIVVSGLSGSGKSTVLRTLEDAAYFAVDNLPPELWGALGDLARARGLERVAVSTDARTREFLAAVEPSLERLKRREDVRIIFLEADDEELLRRYNLTRRTHPMGEDSLMLDFQRERELLAVLRSLAEIVIDTTRLTGAQLATHITQLLNVKQDFDLRLTTFGFKHAPPRDADLVLDVRTLPNPYYDPRLRPRTGQDPEVAAYVFDGPDSEAFYLQLREYVRQSAERAKGAGRHSYSVAVGCTVGQHRSVAVAERLRAELGDLGARIIDHRDMALGEHV